MSQTRLILQKKNYLNQELLSAALEIGAAVTALAAVSRGQEEEAVRAVREQAAAHQTFLFRLQLKRFVFK
jgi:hypothetical protein